METPPPMPAGPPPPEKKKGLPALAWVGIGCGGLLVIGVLAVALLIGWGKRTFDEFADDMAADPHRTAARAVVEMSPELEMVAEDEEAGELTVRVVDSGEEMTVSYSELSEGRVKWTGPDGAVTRLGTADLSKVPAWVPRYPAVEGDVTVFQRQAGGATEGLMTFSTTDSVDRVEAFYDGEMSSFSSVSSSWTEVGSTRRVSLSYSDSDRELDVTASTSGSAEPTRVQVSYSNSGP